MKKIIMWLLILIAGCNQNERKDAQELIKSKDPDDLVEGSYLIGEQKDTGSIPQLLSNMNDPRISNNIAFKGISVYQSKMIALKKISVKEPPIKITYKPDSSIIKFYKDWVKLK